MKQLQLGILGTGNIARQFSQDLGSARRVQLKAIGSRRGQTAQAFADDFGVPQAYDSYEALLADEQLDAVYISLPNSLHCEWSIKALEAGKHVLCEKPLGATTDEVKQMFAAARANQRTLVEAFMYRFHPLMPAIRNAIQEGEIGELKAIRANFCFRVRQPAGNVRFRSDMDGGSLMDVGVYCISFSRYIAGEEPDAAFAVGEPHESGVDGLVGGCLHFPNGVVSVFLCGLTAQNDNTVLVCGSEGYIEIPFAWKPPAAEATFTIVRQAPPKMDHDKLGGTLAVTPPPQVRYVDSSNSLYGKEADDFARTVLDGAEPVISEADSLGNVKVVEQLRSLLNN